MNQLFGADRSREGRIVLGTLLSTAIAPEYVAPTYAYLVSDLAKDVTGEIFTAAGGSSARFDRQTPSLVAYRGHGSDPPWTIDEIAAQVRS